MCVPARPTVDFDEYSDSYREAIEESISFSGAELDLFRRAKVETLLELAGHVGAAERLAFLDVGCGPGESDRFLEGRVGRLAGVDIAQRMLERARAINPWAEYRGFKEGESLPFAEESFDVCFAICVFHHVPRDQRVGLVDEMRRVCRRGGLVALFEHNPYNPLTRRAVNGCEFDRDAELLSRRRAEQLLRAAGLTRPWGRYIVFFPRESRLLRAIEGRLGWLPLGAQYVAFAQRT
jgi:SAM-dependent methyltransferase